MQATSLATGRCVKTQHHCCSAAVVAAPLTCSAAARSGVCSTSCRRQPPTGLVAHPFRRSSAIHAGAMDVMPEWTLDQIAGLAFGGVLLAFLVSANQVDVFVARQQRKQLGLCPQCGGLYEASSCVEKGCPMVSAAAKAQEQKPEQQRPPGGG